MGLIHAAAPVKLFTGIIAAPGEYMRLAEDALTGRHGPVDVRSAVVPFSFTDYYREEMGDNLLRCWLGFRELVDPGKLPEVKHATNALEVLFSEGSGRRVNIDPGYLTPAKVVLASTKDYSHRVFLSDGIYGEVTLFYRDGKFEALPWTYPDYQSPAAFAFLAELRKTYREQTKTGRTSL